MTLARFYRPESGNEAKYAALLHFSATINTESQCVTSAMQMQVTNAPSVVNASAGGRERYLILSSSRRSGKV